MRRYLVAANWKMHGTAAVNEALMQALLQRTLPAGVEVLVCPPFPYLAQVVSPGADSAVEVGAQDCSHMENGAYTGEVAAPMLADVGCRWVIVGHSERRQYHRESSPLLAAKLAAASDAGLTPILCVGETREQREGGEAERVVADQLQGALADQLPPRLVVAYEPVWAIGTGLTATPAEAQAMHAFVRAELARLGADPAGTRILYGGSVKADNAAELFSCPDIDGALVGGASLDAVAFSHIIAAAG